MLSARVLASLAVMASREGIFLYPLGAGMPLSLDPSRSAGSEPALFTVALEATELALFSFSNLSSLSEVKGSPPSGPGVVLELRWDDTGDGARVLPAG